MHNVQRSLAAGTIKKNRVAFEMCTDVFRFLFDGKGVNRERGYQEYGVADFDATFFRGEWYVNIDKNGDGCAIDFPLRMKSCICWTRHYGSKMFFERVFIFLVKKRV